MPGLFFYIGAGYVKRVKKGPFQNVKIMYGLFQVPNYSATPTFSILRIRANLATTKGNKEVCKATSSY